MKKNFAIFRTGSGLEMGKLSHARLSVPDITCTACVETIESLFKGDENVKIRVVLVPEKEATVYFRPENVTLDQIREKIEDSGFDTTVIEQSEDVQNGSLEKRTEFIIEGMTCNSCTGKSNSLFQPGYTIPARNG